MRQTPFFGRRHSCLNAFLQCRQLGRDSGVISCFWCEFTNKRERNLLTFDALLERACWLILVGVRELCDKFVDMRPAAMALVSDAAQC